MQKTMASKQDLLLAEEEMEAIQVYYVFMLPLYEIGVFSYVKLKKLKKYVLQERNRTVEQSINSQQVGKLIDYGLAYL